MYTPLDDYPVVRRDAAAISECRPHPAAMFAGGLIGVDLEWDIKTEVPTVLGVSNGKTTASVPFNEGKEQFRKLLLKYPQAEIVGHNVISSDVQVLKGMGITIDLKKVQDTILWHWLTNAHLSKTTAKDADAENVRRGAGFNNLWTMASLATNLPNWKYCREASCEGPCPKHDVFGYNGLDALAPVLAMPSLLRTAKLLGVDTLYGFHRDLSAVLYEMRTTGVFVNQKYVEKLRTDWIAGKEVLYNKETLDGQLPFNPDSPKQVKEYFNTHPVEIDGKMRRISLKNTTEDTIKATISRLGFDVLDGESEDEGPAGSGLPEPIRALLTLRDWKAQGDGPDRWFAPRVWDGDDWVGFVDPDGFIHAHLSFFTSTARMMCSAPNLQNMPARRKDPITGEKMKKKIRRALIAPPGYYLMKADLSNAENRVFLGMAGYLDLPVKEDLHVWVATLAGFKPEDRMAQILGGVRDAGKSLQHAGNYGEGLDLVHPNDLRSPRIQNEIRAHARIVFPKWTFQGLVVTFTGTNLARRMFGSATWENRATALSIQEKYFTRFSKVRELQMRITKQAEEEKMVRPPNGYVLRSYGYPADRIKTALATYGQQPVAHITKVAIMRAWSVREKIRPVLQVHDELLFYVPNRIRPSYAKRLAHEVMEIPTPDIPGLKVPIDVATGESWGDAE